MKNTQDNDGSTLAPVTGSANRGGGGKLLAQADCVCRMVCKLLRDDTSQNAAKLKAAANVWLDNYHGAAGSGEDAPNGRMSDGL